MTAIVDKIIDSGMWGLIALFAMVLVAAFIADRKKTMKILQWILIGIGVILLGWLALKFKVNIGKYINNLFGRRGKMPNAILNSGGEVIGQEVEIVQKKNPIRDRGVIETSDGQKIELPKGVADTQVEKVTLVGTGTYNVEVKHERLTDVFDSDSSS